MLAELKFVWNGLEYSMRDFQTDPHGREIVYCNIYTKTNSYLGALYTPIPNRGDDENFLIPSLTESNGDLLWEISRFFPIEWLSALL